MKNFLVMPENARWMQIEATTPEMAYRQVSCWFRRDERIAVMDPETHITTIYTHDENGNVVIVAN